MISVLNLQCLSAVHHWAVPLVVAFGSQGSGEEEDLDEDDSLSEDSGSELQDDLQDDSEQSFGKSQPTTPSPSPPATPRPTRRRRKPRSPSFSDDENRPPSPKVEEIRKKIILRIFTILYFCFWANCFQINILFFYTLVLGEVAINEKKMCYVSSFTREIINVQDCSSASRVGRIIAIDNVILISICCHKMSCFNVCYFFLQKSVFICVSLSDLFLVFCKLNLQMWR